MSSVYIDHRGRQDRRETKTAGLHSTFIQFNQLMVKDALSLMLPPHDNTACSSRSPPPPQTPQLSWVVKLDLWFHPYLLSPLTAISQHHIIIIGMHTLSHI